MINHIVFDIDGTLVDSTSILLSTLREVSLRYTTNVLSEEELKRVWYGKTGDECIEAIGVEGPSRQQALKDWCDLIIKEADKTSEAFEGIIDMFKELKENKITCSCATSRDDRIADYGLQHAGISPYYRALVSAGMTQHPKPFPDSIYLCVELSGAEIEHTLFVGDSLTDMQAAHAAHIPFAFAGWNRNAQRFECDYILEHPCDILNLLNQL